MNARTTRRAVFSMVALAVVTADQAGKKWAVAMGHGLSPHGAAPVVRNPGAAYGLAPHATVAISLITVIAVVLTVVAGWRAPGRGLGWTVALALVAGGAAGNGADRLLRTPGILHGAVVDWLSVPWYRPVFNLADLALRLGGVLFLIVVARPGSRGATALNERQLHPPQGAATPPGSS